MYTDKEVERYVTLYMGQPITEIKEAVMFLEKYKKTPTYMKLIATLKAEAAELAREEKRKSLEAELARINTELQKLDEQ